MTDQQTPQHTPGPWEMDQFIRRTYIVWGPDGQAVCALEDRGGEMIDNARLIAAAPELLAALAAVVGIADRHPDLTVADLTVALDRARAAIANATGAA